MILPGQNVIPESVSDCFTDVMSYKLLQLPLYTLLEVPFISAFVKKGIFFIVQPCMILMFQSVVFLLRDCLENGPITMVILTFWFVIMVFFSLVTIETIYGHLKKN